MIDNPNVLYQINEHHSIVNVQNSGYHTTFKHNSADVTYRSIYHIQFVTKDVNLKGTSL